MTLAALAPQAPSVMSAVRGVVAALCFAPLLAAERRELASEPPLFWRAAVELTAYNALYEGLLNLSVVHTDATRTAFLFESSVLFTPALATLMGARVAPTTWGAAAAAAVGTSYAAPLSRSATGHSPLPLTFATPLVGVALLAGDNMVAAGLTLTAGDAEAIAAALAYSCYVLRMSDFGASGLSTDLTQGVKCILMAAVYLGWAGVDVAFASAAGVRTMDELGAALWPGIASGAAWAALLYSGVVPGAVADVLQARGQAKVRASEAQVLLAAEPLWTAVLGAALLHEHMSPRDWAGAALIVGAVAVSSGLSRRVAAAVRREWRRRRGLLPADEGRDAAAALPPPSDGHGVE